MGKFTNYVSRLLVPKALYEVDVNILMNGVIIGQTTLWAEAKGGGNAEEMVKKNVISTMEIVANKSKKMSKFDRARILKRGIKINVES